MPLSLDSLSFYLFAFLTFILSLAIDFKDFKKEYLAYFIFFIGFVFSLLSLFFLFNQKLAASLPGMNLIYATYGHNHLAAFLLLILPLSWREVFISFQNKERGLYLLKLIGTLFMSFTLLISFGRTALFIGILQLCFIWIFYFRSWKKNPILSKFIFPSMVLILIAILSFKMYFSYFLSMDKEFTCPFPSWIDSKICKPLDSEMRPLYFAQTFQTMHEYPLVGYGPGSFQLISTKYRQLPHSSTFYAHNHFLQVGAEMGILAAAVFLLLIISLFWQTGRIAFPRRAKIKIFDFNQALFIGSFSLLINAFFDFDWSYLGIFSLTLFFLGLILRTKQSISRKQIDDSLVAFISQAIAILLLFLASLYLLLEILTRTGRVGLAFDIFPYFKEHKKLFEKEADSFSSTQISKLTKIYQFDSSAYFLIQEDLENLTDEQLAIRKNLYLIDPWLNLTSKDIDWYLKKGDYQTADRNLAKLIEVVEIAEEKLAHQLGFTKKFELATQKLDIADYYFKYGESRKTAEYYLWARSVEPWIFAHRLPPVSSQTSVSDLEEFLLVTMNQNPEEWGENYYNFINWHLRVFRKAIADGDAEKIKFWFELIDQKFSNLTFFLWKIGSTSLIDSLNDDSKANNSEYLQQKITLWSSLWEIYNQNSVKKDFDEYEKELSESLINLSQIMVNNSNLTKEQKDYFQMGMASASNLEGRLQLAMESYFALEETRLNDITMKMLSHVRNYQ